MKKHALAAIQLMAADRNRYNTLAPNLVMGFNQSPRSIDVVINFTNTFVESQQNGPRRQQPNVATEVAFNQA